MTREEALTFYKNWQEKKEAYGLVMSTAYYDQETIAPQAGSAVRNKALAYLSGEVYDIETDPKAIEVLEFLAKEDLGEEKNREIALALRSLDGVRALDKEEVVAFNEESMASFDDWQKAKHEKDYAKFEPHLLKLIGFSKRFAAKRHPDMDPYDVYLDDYEEGMTAADYDRFFDLVRSELSPLVFEIAQHQDRVDDSFLHLDYPKDRQAKFAEDICKALGFSRDWGYMGISEHPFTNGISKNDVRITTAYDEKDVSASLYSIVHEVGHAFFEHQVKDEFAGTPLHHMISSGMHESQSRFLENYIGRRKAFLKGLYPKLQEYFPEQLGNVSLDAFWRAVNASRPSLIRTQADELTYPLHILIRYEIEKSIFKGTADLEHLNTLWNEKYKEYLGVEVPDDGAGILQDVHWSGASFGYFPTYALGSAIGAQLLHAMEKDVNIDEALEKGEFSKITDWLKEHFQQYGARYTFKEAVVKATGEEFDPHYYIDYLKKKYRTLYGLDQ